MKNQNPNNNIITVLPFVNNIIPINKNISYSTSSVGVGTSMSIGKSVGVSTNTVSLRSVMSGDGGELLAQHTISKFVHENKVKELVEQIGLYKRQADVLDAKIKELEIISDQAMNMDTRIIEMIGLLRKEKASTADLAKKVAELESIKIQLETSHNLSKSDYEVAFGEVKRQASIIQGEYVNLKTNYDKIVALNSELERTKNMTTGQFSAENQQLKSTINQIKSVYTSANQESLRKIESLTENINQLVANCAQADITNNELANVVNLRNSEISDLKQKLSEIGLENPNLRERIRLATRESARAKFRSATQKSKLIRQSEIFRAQSVVYEALKEKMNFQEGGPYANPADKMDAINDEFIQMKQVYGENLEELRRSITAYNEQNAEVRRLRAEISRSEDKGAEIMLSLRREMEIRNNLGAKVYPLQNQVAAQKKELEQKEEEIKNLKEQFTISSGGSSRTVTELSRRLQALEQERESIIGERNQLQSSLRYEQSVSAELKETTSKLNSALQKGTKAHKRIEQASQVKIEELTKLVRKAKDRRIEYRLTISKIERSLISGEALSYNLSKSQIAIKKSLDIVLNIVLDRKLVIDALTQKESVNSSLKGEISTMMSQQILLTNEVGDLKGKLLQSEFVSETFSKELSTSRAETQNMSAALNLRTSELSNANAAIASLNIEKQDLLSKLNSTKSAVERAKKGMLESIRVIQENKIQNNQLKTANIGQFRQIVEQLKTSFVDNYLQYKNALAQNTRLSSNNAMLQAELVGIRDTFLVFDSKVSEFIGSGKSITENSLQNLLSYMKQTYALPDQISRLKNEIENNVKEVFENSSNIYIQGINMQYLEKVTQIQTEMINAKSTMEEKIALGESSSNILINDLKDKLSNLQSELSARKDQYQRELEKLQRQHELAADELASQNAAAIRTNGDRLIEHYSSLLNASNIQAEVTVKNIEQSQNKLIFDYNLLNEQKAKLEGEMVSAKERFEEVIGRLDKEASIRNNQYATSTNNLVKQIEQKGLEITEMNEKKAIMEKTNFQMTDALKRLVSDLSKYETMLGNRTEKYYTKILDDLTRMEPVNTRDLNNPLYQSNKNLNTMTKAEFLLNDFLDKMSGSIKKHDNQVIQQEKRSKNKLKRTKKEMKGKGIDVEEMQFVLDQILAESTKPRRFKQKKPLMNELVVYGPQKPEINLKPIKPINFGTQPSFLNTSKFLSFGGLAQNIAMDNESTTSSRTTNNRFALTDI